MDLPVELEHISNDSATTDLRSSLDSCMENGEEKLAAPVTFVDCSEGAVIPDVFDNDDAKAAEIATNTSTFSDKSDEDGSGSDGTKDKSDDSKSSKTKKSVSFNGSLTKEIDVDFHKLGFNNWNGVPPLTKDEVLSAYQAICNEQKIDADDEIMSQLSGMQNNSNFSMMLNLLDVRITSDKLDIYEKLFQIVNFHKLYVNVDLLQNDAVVEIFHMIEYYNSTKELILYGNYVNDSGLWSSIAVAVSNNNNNLNKVSIHELRITDRGLMSIFNSINENSHIKVLRFNGCKLNFTPTFSIATPLRANQFLKELHLCNADLYYKETTILALFLRDNYTLKVLNLSNNKLGDRGFRVLVKALVEQARHDGGISVLMVANNRLNKAISSNVEILLKNCPIMHSINVGCNNLTDEFIIAIKETLEACTTLKTFGLQSTLLTIDGVAPLMEVCTKNEILQYLNLRGNRALQHEALQTIVAYLPHTHLKHLELDDANRFCTDAQEYIQILNNIRKLLMIKSSNDTFASDKYSFTPEMALSCDIDYIPRCLTWRTPRNRGRFEVVSVPEATFTATSSAPSIRESATVTTTTIASSTEVPTSKEPSNWSPTYSSYSQKANWSKMKALENDDGAKKSDENGVIDKILDDKNNDPGEFSKIESDQKIEDLAQDVALISLNHNLQDTMIVNKNFKKNSDYDFNMSIVSVNSNEIVVEQQLISKELCFNSPGDENLIPTSPSTDSWVTEQLEENFCKSGGACDEENQYIDKVESNDRADE